MQRRIAVIKQNDVNNQCYITEQICFLILDLSEDEDFDGFVV
jgi:hypothetical protein